MLRKRPKPPIGDIHDPEGLYNLMRRFLACMEEKHCSQETVSTRERHLRWFLIWCDERGLTKPSEIDSSILERYQRHLFYYRKANGEPLAIASQHLRLIPLGLWFKWMAKKGTIPSNPAAELELPKLGLRLPKAVLTAKEAEAVLAMPDIRTRIGLRDRAILETFYSTGMRRAELIRLHMHQVDFERGVVLIREGKGGKDRIVPIGERALAWIGAYLERSRPALERGQDDGVLFLTNRGRGFSLVRLTSLVEAYVRTAGIGKRGSCHLFRHTAATLMLENGADIRALQEILGHAELTTTQIYTRVSIGHLKAIHTATHPGRLAKVGQHGEPDEPGGGGGCPDTRDHGSTRNI
nr:site-specific tyrosine recombinase XerC [uncultured Holophaga sp.]